MYPVYNELNFYILIKFQKMFDILCYLKKILFILLGTLM